MNLTGRPHPAHVPTLTEVIEVGSSSEPSNPQQPPHQQVQPQGVATGPITNTALTSPSPAAIPLDPLPVLEGQLAQRVLNDVQRQIDSMLEFRLREAMAPVLARHSEAIVRELKEELARTMRDVVARSVAQEVAKQRQR